MNRNEFLNNVGVTLGATAIVHALASCSKSSPIPNPTGGFTVDLTSSANSALKTVGGFILTQGIYVICTAASTYVALSSICTHQGCTVAYVAINKQFSCPCHGGLYDITGKVLTGPPPAPLKSYSVTLNGNILTIG
jgi:cytochrome b6-f complex iron-sulfur subunit